MDKIILSDDMEALTGMLGARLGGTWTWDVLYPPYRNVLLRDGKEVLSSPYMRQLYADALKLMECRETA